MTRPDFITKCRRCGDKFAIKSGLHYLSDFCGTCRRLLGIHGLSPERQAQMARNYQWQLGQESAHRIITPYEFNTLTGGTSRPFVFMGKKFEPRPIR